MSNTNDRLERKARFMEAAITGLCANTVLTGATFGNRIHGGGIIRNGELEGLAFLASEIADKAVEQLMENTNEQTTKKTAV